MLQVVRSLQFYYVCYRVGVGVMAGLRFDLRLSIQQSQRDDPTPSPTIGKFHHQEGLLSTTSVSR